MDTYPAGERLNDLVLDCVVAGHLARDRKLTPDYADALAMRVRSKSVDMVEPADAQLLLSTANALSAIATRIKAREVRPRVKAGPAPGPSIRDMIRQWDAERMAGGSSSSLDPDVEAARLAEANRQLSERIRQLEAERARQVGR